MCYRPDWLLCCIFGHEPQIPQHSCYFTRDGANMYKNVICSIFGANVLTTSKGCPLMFHKAVCTITGRRTTKWALHTSPDIALFHSHPGRTLHFSVCPLATENRTKKSRKLITWCPCWTNTALLCSKRTDGHTASQFPFIKEHHSHAMEDT